MFVQIVIGGSLILFSCLIAGLIWWGLEVTLGQCARWFGKRPYGRRIVAGMMIAGLWTLLLLTVNVWLWAVAFRAVGAFDALEPAVYFALVVFTTLGYGDVLLGPDWRLLGGLAAANGLLSFGIVTALLVETLRGVRRVQGEGGFLDF